MNKKRKIILVFICLFIFFLALIGYIKIQNEWQIDLKSRIELHNQLPDLIPFPTKIHFFDTIFYYIHEGIFNWVFLMLPIIVCVPAVLDFFYIIKSKMLIYLSNREKYQKVIKKELSKCYIPVLIVPVLFINIIIFSYIYSNIVQPEYMANNIIYLEQIGVNMSPIIFVFVMVLNLCLISVFYINVALLIVDKVKKFSLLIVFSFLVITAYQIISEVFIGLLLYSITQKTFFANIFSLYNLWYYDGGITPYMSFIYALILAIVSTILVKRKYNNIEKVVNENEK